MYGCLTGMAHYAFAQTNCANAGLCWILPFVTNPTTKYGLNLSPCTSTANRFYNLPLWFAQTPLNLCLLVILQYNIVRARFYCKLSELHDENTIERFGGPFGNGCL
jgi:hypothetical protein